MFEVYLKAGRDKPGRMGHPWIFSGAISKVVETGENGGQCRIFSHNGEYLALGYYNPQSAINVRILSHHNEKFDSDTLKFRIARAVSARRAILDNKTDSCRLVNSEGDFVPGLIVDNIPQDWVIQILTAGMELFRNSIIDILNQELSPAFIYERSDPGCTEAGGIS
jgi:23S rRNA (cytosine1962-C5)-methyltransferase